MRHLSLREYEKVSKGGEGEQTSNDKRVISRRDYARLRRFDDQLEAREESRVFGWPSGAVKARKWVGVVQIPGLTVEILPKIESDSTEERTSISQLGRKNLLYMLAVAKQLPIREQDVASLAVQQAPLHDTLIAIFARRLVEAFEQGRHQFYVAREENLHVLRGKLVFNEHIKRNAARRDRFYVRHDEFLPDTTINRILKAACSRLVTKTTSSQAQRDLRRSLMLLDEVRDVQISREDFERIVFNRQNRRFEVLLNFCQLVLFGQTTGASQGNLKSFSLLFNMQELFEAFMAEFIRREVFTVELLGEKAHDYKVRAQAKGAPRYLVYGRPESLIDDEDLTDYRPRRDGREKEGYKLKPDILVEDREGDPVLIIDTKWKRLSADRTRQGVRGSDIYQLYGYARTYDTSQNVLLFPDVAGENLKTQVFDLPIIDPIERGAPKCIRSDFVDLQGDLKANRRAIARQLKRILMRSIGASDAEATMTAMQHQPGTETVS